MPSEHRSSVGVADAPKEKPRRRAPAAPLRCDERGITGRVQSSHRQRSGMPLEAAQHVAEADVSEAHHESEGAQRLGH